MADYPVKFYLYLPWPAGVDAADQAAFAAAYHAHCAALASRASSEEDYDLLCLGVQVECQPHGWQIQDDGGEGQITAAVYAIQFFLRHFHLEQAVVLEWSCGAVKPEPGAFHGGAVLVTAQEEHWFDPGRLACLLAKTRGWAEL